LFRIARRAYPIQTLQWVGPPGSPIPWKSYSISSATLGPAHKIAVGAGVTREMVAHGKGQEVVGQLLREDAALSLDASMFSTEAASTSRPAGLLNGLAAITGTAGGDYAPFKGDIQKLGSALSRAGSSDNIVFIMAPEQALSAAMQPAYTKPPTIWATLCLLPAPSSRLSRSRLFPGLVPSRALMRR
jgi:hypothetical protein